MFGSVSHILLAYFWPMPSAQLLSGGIFLPILWAFAAMLFPFCDHFPAISSHFLPVSHHFPVFPVISLLAMTISRRKK